MSAASFSPPPAYLADLRARLAARAGMEETAAAQAWRDLPQPVKRHALGLAGLDPLRECMPLRTFTDAERCTLRDVADRLAAQAAQLRKVAP